MMIHYAFLVGYRNKSLYIIVLRFIKIKKNKNLTLFIFFRYLVRPSPFSAQKTFERHNSRRKSNISFSNINIGAALSGGGSRRGSALALNQLQMQNMQPLAGYAPTRAPPPIQQIKSNSLSLPDSPNNVVGPTRARSNSLRVGFFVIVCKFSISLTHGKRTNGRTSRDFFQFTLKTFKFG